MSSVAAPDPAAPDASQPPVPTITVFVSASSENSHSATMNARKESGRTGRWDRNVSTRTRIARQADPRDAEDTETGSLPALPKNGFRVVQGRPPLAVVAGVATDRDMTKVVTGDPGETYALPGTAVAVCRDAFDGRGKRRLTSVRLNEGLEVLEERCFARSGLRRLVLPASVKSVGPGAFRGCRRLEHADLRAARGLRELGEGAFESCVGLE